MAGTVIEVIPLAKDFSTLSGVAVRIPDGNVQEIPATFVIGALSSHYLEIVDLLLLSIDCTGGAQAGLKWLRRIASKPENVMQIQSLSPSSSLPWDKLRITYDCAVRFIVFRFYVPPEARESLPIPGGYENNVWPYTYTPVAGKERIFFAINRIEGHRSA